MSNPSERDRIQALLDAGRITQAEADILFAALEESGAAREPGDALLSPMTDTGSGEPTRPDASPAPPRPDAPRGDPEPTDAGHLDPVPAPPTPPEPADAQPPQFPEPPPLPFSPAESPTGWVRLSGFCGDLSVESDPGIGAPVVTGHATLERTDTGYLIRTPPADREGGRNWLTRLHKAAGDVTVRLPAELGLDLGVAAGDGDIRGVRALKGNFTGGDFDVDGAETIDLTVTAGDVTLKLRPKSGAGRLKATSGDLNVIFLPGTSAAVSGSATCGDLDMPPGFTRSGGFASHSFEGTLGAGEARLELRLTAGDVTIRAKDA